MIIDKLYKEIEKKGFVCVGLDTHLSYIPSKFNLSKVYDSVFNFNKSIIDSTHEEVAIYKLQIAYYEAMGIEGLRAYSDTLKYLKNKGLLSIGDVKRGDISATAQEYAKAHFSGEFETDFITLNPYMGFDSITPYLDYVKNNNKGIFVLLRTSNQGAKDIEYLNVEGEALYYKVGDKLYEIAKNYMGKCGYSSIGMVVGGTHSKEAKEIRDRYTDVPFLIPGYGAQGGKPEDIRIYLGKDFNGGVVNSSRGIITAYKKYEDGNEKFEYYTKKAILEMKKDIYGR